MLGKCSHGFVFVFFLISLGVVAYWKDHYFLSITLCINVVNMAAGEVLWHPWLAVELCLI